MCVCTQVSYATDITVPCAVRLCAVNMIQSIFLEHDKDCDDALNYEEYTAFLKNINSWGKTKCAIARRSSTASLSVISLDRQV